jgi:hypothetical protein
MAGSGRKNARRREERETWERGRTRDAERNGKKKKRQKEETGGDGGREEERETWERGRTRDAERNGKNRKRQKEETGGTEENARLGRRGGEGDGKPGGRGVGLRIGRR